MERINERVESVYTQELVPIEALDDAKSALYRIRGDVLEHIMAKRTESKVRLKGEILEQSERFDRRIAQFRKSRLDPDEVALLAQVEASAHAYRSVVVAQVLHLSELETTHKQEEAEILARGEAVLLFREAREAINNLMDHSLKRAYLRKANAAHDFRNAILYVSLAVLGVLILGLFAAARIGQTISRPVSEMARTMRELAQGNLAVQAPPLYFNDEVYELEQALDVFKANAQELEQLAYFDPLTGLPNRRLFADRLQMTLDNSSRHQRQAALLFIDLDLFKRINDGLGHHVGDIVLREVAKRFATQVRVGDTLSRMGGDEFTLLMTDIETQFSLPQKLAARLLDTLSAPIEIDGQNLHIGASIGIAIYPEDGNNAATLMQNADTAMYRVKSSRRGGAARYSMLIDNQVHEQIQLETALRQAITNDEIYLAYQCKVDLGSGRVNGVEALARWNDVNLGQIPPLEFISIAEKIGLGEVLFMYLLERACLQAVVWQSQGYHLPIAVNVSSYELHHDKFLAKLQEILRKTKLEPSSLLLNLEITESTLMQDIDTVLPILETLSEMGVHLSIDDFGTGYSSFGYLLRLPVKTLKIDRSFIINITTDEKSAKLAQAMILMAHELGLKTVAEGVESTREVGLLKTMGCDEVQGYIYSRPSLAEDIEAQIRSGALLLNENNR
jgi:diguanylate cyclase (GGDEF)-like protein